jgi:hypothetical protein
MVDLRRSASVARADSISDCISYKLSYTFSDIF